MKNRQKIRKIFYSTLISMIPLIIGILPFIYSCSTPNKKPFDPNSSPGGNQSSVTVDYELGRDHYLFQVVSDNHIAQVKNYLGKHLLKEGLVSPEKYISYFNKANLFMNIPQSLSAKSRPCRGPFTVTVVAPDSTKVSKGCRSNGEGAISRLIREGEFLLYSAN